MPIYDIKDYEKVIARIQKKVAARNIKLGECLSEGVIIAFEENCNVQLPQAYRAFLKCVGNGCHCMIDGFQLKCLQDIEKQDLSQPFMLEEAWVWEVCVCQEKTEPLAKKNFEPPNARKN